MLRRGPRTPRAGPDSGLDPPPTPRPARKARAADSSDPVATALTRRFGLGGGLAWAAVLTAGVLGEQVKTRLEEADAVKNTKAGTTGVAIPLSVKGVTVYAVDEVVGGGPRVEKGLLVILNSTLTASVNGGERIRVDDTRSRNKPAVLLFGTKPLPALICPGAEAALAGMRAGGVRLVTVPPAAGFGENGKTLRPTEHAPDKMGEVPPGATLEYRLEVLRVSIPPS